MADYNTLLNTWGATGSVYPSGYSYVEGEQPVDDWDNFFAYNTVEDIQYLISLTNKRVETGSGTSFPSSPNESHAFYRSDDERLYTWNSTRTSWNGLLKVDGDTMQGDLDVGGHSLSGIGSLSMAGTADLSGNDFKDTSAGNLLYDSSAGHIPLNALEQSAVTVNTGSHLSGGGSLTLGGSLTVDVDDDFLLNTGDRVTGELVSERSSSSRAFTATDSSSGDKLSLRISGNNTFQLVGYDSSDGAWDYNSSLSYNPGTSRWSFGSLPSVNGNNLATQSWVDSNADVPNADYADSAGTAGDADTVDGWDKSNIQTYVSNNSAETSHGTEINTKEDTDTSTPVSLDFNVSGYSSYLISVKSVSHSSVTDSFYINVNNNTESNKWTGYENSGSKIGSTTLRLGYGDSYTNTTLFAGTANIHEMPDQLYGNVNGAGADLERTTQNFYYSKNNTINSIQFTTTDNATAEVTVYGIE